jgi:hypothetical protein
MKDIVGSVKDASKDNGPTDHPTVATLLTFHSLIIAETHNLLLQFKLEPVLLSAIRYYVEGETMNSVFLRLRTREK